MNRRALVIALPFLVAFLGLAVYFLVADFGGIAPYGDNAKYLIVLINPVFVLLELFIVSEKPLQKRRIMEGFLLVFALIFTAISDYFLLFDNSRMVFALSTFLLAQNLHFIRLYFLNGKKLPYLIYGISARILLGATLLAVGLSAIAVNATVGVGAFYVAGLFLNFADSVFLSIKGKPNRLRFLLLATGFGLFVACDVTVGLRYLGNEPVWPWIWVFYAPSQALIGASIISDEEQEPSH